MQNIKNDVVILIPAYNPDDELKDIINELNENRYTEIVVINDGSKNDKIFNEVVDKAKILKHAENKGKGMTLKTGMRYCIENFKNKKGIITVDADGQHLVEDINKVYNVFIQNRGSIILGSRNFHDKGIPFKRKIGNIVFRNIFKNKTKKDIKDTQTGLRAIPFEYLNNFIMVAGERYEYETNMLLQCIKNDISIIEVEIKSIYRNKNTHFNSIKDSIKIFRTVVTE